MSKSLAMPGTRTDDKPAKSKGAIRRTLRRWKDKAALLFVASTLAVVASCSFDSGALKDAPDASHRRPDATARHDGGTGDAKTEDAKLPPYDGMDMDGGQEDSQIQDDSQVQDDAQAPKWNPAWKYCRDITVTNMGSVSIPSSHPLAVDVQISDPTLASVRFMKGTCETPDNSSFLPMWVESSDGAGNGRIWTVVGVQDPLGFAMIYGNSGAASVSDGKSVFPFFDDFKGTSLDTSKWVCQGTCTVSGNELTLSNATAYPALRSNNQFGVGISMEAKAAFSGSAAGNYDAYLGFSNVSPATPYVLWVYNGPSEAYPLQFNTQENPSSPVATDNSYHVYRIDRDQLSADYHYDGTLATTVTDQYPFGNYPLMAHPNNAAITVKLKWVLARPKMEQEPETSVGGEQTQ